MEVVWAVELSALRVALPPMVNLEIMEGVKWVMVKVETMELECLAQGVSVAELSDLVLVKNPMVNLEVMDLELEAMGLE